MTQCWSAGQLQQPRKMQRDEKSSAQGRRQSPSDPENRRISEDFGRAVVDSCLSPRETCPCKLSACTQQLSGLIHGRLYYFSNSEALPGRSNEVQLKESRRDRWPPEKRKDETMQKNNKPIRIIDNVHK
jgi:hypothetical protein